MSPRGRRVDSETQPARGPRSAGENPADDEHLQHFPRLSRLGRARGTSERVVVGTPYIIVFELRQGPVAVIIVAIAHGAQNR
jgi:plasmid stabilization system protein ParE